MEKIIDLKDLLKHEILDLYSAEEQIIEGLPKMIENGREFAKKQTLESWANEYHATVSEFYKKP